MRSPLAVLILALFLLIGPAGHAAVAASARPVLIGFDGAFGHRTSTSEEAIKRGILIAIDEINRGGGVLSGRPLKLVTRDNRSVPARGVENVKEFAAMRDLVAVFCGKFSPVAQEAIPVLHERKLILLDPWAAADNIIDNGHVPNFAFRLSLRDSWAMERMLGFARKHYGSRASLLLPITGWGRSNENAAKQYVADHPGMELVSVHWYNWGDASLLDQYRAARKAGAEAIILVANEAEGSVLVKEVAALPESERLPIVCHWGVSGGKLTELTGPTIGKVDFTLVQTFSFLDAKSDRAHRVLASARRLFGVTDARTLPSPVGVAHAYDLTHILARAIDRAGSTDRSAIRDALEQVADHDGLVKHYERPFTETRHEALSIADVYMARFAPDGAIERIEGE
jgi:branched-chain amino acid transport system substrate-binding protein